MMLERFRPIAAVADPQLGTDIIPDEVFLLIPALRARAAKGGILESFIVDIVDRFTAMLQDQTKSPKESVRYNEIIRKIKLIACRMLEPQQEAVRLYPIHKLVPRR